MGTFDEYLDRARDLAEDAGDMAKNAAGNIMNKVKDLSDERSKVRELAESAKEQSASLAIGAREKVQGVLQDAKAGKEIRQGITELENLPEFEGSIVYKMDLEAMLNDLGSLLLFINDRRLDDASVVEEIRKVMDKVRPAQEPQAGEPGGVQTQGAVTPGEPGVVQLQEATDEDKAIQTAKTIAFNACTRALQAIAQ